MKLRSLFVATAAALISLGFMVPRVDAFVVSYFNFEDTVGTTVDKTPDKTVAAGGDNAGGGIEPSTTNLTFAAAGNQPFVTPGLLINRTTSPADQDTANPGFAIAFHKVQSGTASISFGVNLVFYQGLSLSFATDDNGNGYGSVTLSWTVNGGPTMSLPTVDIPPSPGETIAFTLPASLNGDGMTPNAVVFTLTFSNGHSNGNDLQTVVDNIRLDTTTIVPEPSTVAGGLLGVIGLCWFQRRRIRLILARCGFRGLRRA